jgi:hypothetical protein
VVGPIRPQGERRIDQLNKDGLLARRVGRGLDD